MTAAYLDEEHLHCSKLIPRLCSEPLQRAIAHPVRVVSFVVVLELFPEFEETGCCERVSVRLQTPNDAFRDGRDGYPGPGGICSTR